MNILKWIKDNILFVLTLFLLAFIPLYPKLPLVDVRNTWVYIRVEDFFVVFVLLLWTVLLFCKKITLKTPLTVPIIFFWIVGAIATMHGVLLIFPTLSGLSGNVAFLSYLRRIEYLSVFFVAYAGMKDKRFVPYVVGVLVATLLGVTFYGFGQKFLSFPAYLTMNEEFAKGIPVTLSSLSRIPSTFAGHYDLAAYLVLILPLLTSLIFGIRNWFIKLFMAGTVGLGFILLFMTVSRVSFFVLLVSLLAVLIFYKKKWVILGLFFLIAFVSINFSSSLIQRFGSTLKEVQVLVSGTTGEAIGHVKDLPSSYLENKQITVKFAQTKSDMLSTNYTEKELALASASAIPTAERPPFVPIVIETNVSTGEDLPQGTGYINLPLSPITKKLGQFYYEKERKDGTSQGEIISVYGHFLVKKAYAYDLSFTTRFQGEWPHAIEAFEKNIFLGSGYGSVSLAVDNNYFRILGEVGLLGFLSFFGIFLITGIYIKRILPDISSPLAKSFVLGLAAGALGLVLNAVLIDVFEASKIAFLLWLLVGITHGILHLYKKREVHIVKELMTVLSSPLAVVVYLFIVTFVLFSAIGDYYFVGDDFTWFRWVADCGTGMSHQCAPLLTRIGEYFTEANGFFYRPGTKIYFLLMYMVFWLNQTAYHFVSIALHFSVAVLVFFLARRVIKDYFYSALAAFLFLLLSGYSEAVFWISSTGFLFNAVFALLAVLLFAWSREKNNKMYFFLSIVATCLGLLFHEVGVVIPLLIILYDLVIQTPLRRKQLLKRSEYILILLPLLPYAILRFFAHSHWLSGDYNYNILKLPFNTVGNTVGYLLVSAVGATSLPLYEKLRAISKEHIALALFVTVVVLSTVYMVYKKTATKIKEADRTILVFGVLFFLVSLLPFLGLGNITSRYSYLASIGFIFIVVLLLKKLYHYLLGEGELIARASITVLLCIFALTHLIQLQKIHGDWRGAGEKSKAFLISLEKTYTTEPVTFFFVNTPIRNGDAWIFPVGLPDALWFTFQRNYIGVYNMTDVKQALDAAQTATNGRVFVFQDDGSVQWVTRAKSGKIVPKDF